MAVRTSTKRAGATPPAADAPLLELRDVSVEYRSVQHVNRAVTGVSLTVARGEVVGIVGESGSGKSTAILAALGLTRASGTITDGEVLLEGRPLLGLDDERWREIRGKRIGLVTQNPRGALNPVMKVGDQLKRIYRAHHDVDDAAARERALALLGLVGINDPERRLEAFPHELSGGMAQRVVIAMALSCSPSLVLADEPTSGLDVTVQALLLDDLRRAALESGTSLVLVSQDLSIIANYCDRVHVMHAGEIVEVADVETFFAEPAFPGSVALLRAQRGEEDDPFKLRGFPVDGRRLPDGCRLHRRCPFASADDGCMTDHPALRAAGDGHEVRCHRVEAVLAAVADDERARAVAAATQNHEEATR